MGTLGRPRKTSHGEYGYAHRFRCPCDPCRAAIAYYAKRQRYDHDHGTPRRRPAQPVRDHIYWLMTQGVTENQVWRAAGISHTVVTNILHGKPDSPPPKNLLAITVERIMGVTVQSASAFPKKVDAIGVHRRVQAIEYMGHPRSAIAPLAGVTLSMIYAYMEQDFVLSTTVANIHRAFLALRETEGGHVRAAWSARRKGWLPPTSWDDETIDEPTTVPYPAACVAGSCTRPAVRASLCKQHANKVRAKGGFKSPSSYRRHVEAYEKKPIHDRQRLYSDIRDLKELGYTPIRAAERLGKDRAYVARLWRSA